MQKILLIPACVVLLSGCATVFTGTSQSIQLSAMEEQSKEELKNVDCKVVDSSGTVYLLESNPGTVVVSKGKGPLQVSCKEKGYQNYTGAINSNFNAVTLLDVLFWPTFFVDIATGAVQKYPGHYVVEMSPKGA